MGHITFVWKYQLHIFHLTMHQPAYNVPSCILHKLIIRISVFIMCVLHVSQLTMLYSHSSQLHISQLTMHQPAYNVPSCILHKLIICISLIIMCRLHVSQLTIPQTTCIKLLPLLYVSGQCSDSDYRCHKCIWLCVLQCIRLHLT